jgi:uncharacterized protein (TIGR03118 family)
MSAPSNRTAKGRFASSGSARAFAGKIAIVVALSFALRSLPAGAQSAGAYKVTNLISDGSVAANFTDPNFINPWAISTSGTWWISAEGSGFNYVVASTPNPGSINFKVIIPPASGSTTAPGAPSGSVTTAGAVGMLLPAPNGTKANFLFSSTDGVISGWNSKLGAANAVTQVVINNGAAGASYTGLAIVNTGTSSYILAANFGAGKAIEVYDSTFARTQLAGSFTDPNLPAGYAPFSVHVLNGKVYVAYALRTSSAPYDTVDGPGNGAVSVFDTSGNFIARVATGGNLNSPWGVAIAPANFGIFGGSILIGNFGNGMINAYDPAGLSFRGTLTDASAKPLVYDALWELLPGGTTVGNTTSVSGGDPNTVYFTAGLSNEAHGLFGAISNDTASGTPTFALTTSNSSLTVASGSSAQVTLSLQPIYGFTGDVKLVCAGLPVGASCSIAPVQVSSTGASPSLYGVTILTTKKTALLEYPKDHLSGIAYAFLLPFGSILVFRRRRSLGSYGVFRMFFLCGIAFVTLAVLVGCSSNPPTPAGTSQVGITASAGSVSRTATVSLIVQ